MATAPEPRGDRIDDYECLNLLGKGAFASVYRARCRITGQSAAIKMIDKHLMQMNRMTERVKQEADIHRRLSHPAVLQLYRFFEDANFIYLVLELAEHGDIQNYLRLNNIQLTETETANIMRQIVDGLQYLHANNILHRDMKLPNLLVTASMRVKIADFGLATQLSRPDEPHMTMCGTPNYISPEVAMRTAHGQPADVWGLGIMMYTLLVGRPPFDTDAVASTLRRVVQADLQIPAHLSPEARDLLHKLLQKDQRQRIGLSEVLCHPFMAKHLLPSSTKQYDSGLMTMSTTPSISSPGHPVLRQQQTQLHTIPEPVVGMEYDLPPPRKPTAAVESGYADNYSSNSNLNPFLSRQNSVFHPDTAANRFQPLQQENIVTNHQQISVPAAAAIDVAQLNAERLLPTRYETKKAVLSIDADGNVLVELIRAKPKHRPAQLGSAGDCCRISRDGVRIEIYPSDPGRLPGCSEVHTYPHIPSKHWKKYSYAARFVQLVRAKTPKITYYSRLAKCQLMETLVDFEMFFYAPGEERFTRSPADGVRFRTARGLVLEERDFGVRGADGGPSAEQREHFEHCWQHCVQLERALRAMRCEGEVFPNTVGRRPVVQPQVIGASEIAASGGCVSVSSPRNAPNMQSFAMSISSSTASSRHPSSTAQSRPFSAGYQPTTVASGRILIPGIGIATKSALGVLEVQYNDDTQLTVLPKEQGGGFVFRRSVSDANAVPMRYTIADELPELVRVRLEQIPMVLKHMAAQETPPADGGGSSGGALLRPVGLIGATSTPLQPMRQNAMRFCR